MCGMKPVKLSDIVKAVSGDLVWGDGEAVVNRVVTDSREAEEGTLFVPIIGERVDAHRFIPQVLQQGAACVFFSDERERETMGAGIRVKDTLRALQDFAAWYRRGFDIPVIGITGSVGKTTTKEMIGAVMEAGYKTVKTIGNFNSQIGVSLMMFHLEDETEMAVFEMGISMPGEMDRLVDIAAPETAVMTNIGVSHIGNLGSRENICREKGKIITNFCEGGRLYLCGNGDLKELSESSIHYEECRGECQVIFYGTEKDCLYYADQIEQRERGQRFLFHYPGGEEEIVLSVMGAHNVNNAVVALALAQQYNVPLVKAKAALKEYRPIAMRGVIREAGGAHIIDDTYNASPDSITSNVRALFDYGDSGVTAGRIAVLADVLELGERSYELHEGIGRYIVGEYTEGRALSLLVTVGNETEAIHRYVESHSPIPAVHCKDNEQAAEVVRKRMKPGDWILVKGSRGMHMDEVVEKLTKE